MPGLTPEQFAALETLANGIIPADQSDNGAASVGAASSLANKIQAGIHAATYLNGVEAAQSLAREMFGGELSLLHPEQVHEVLGVLRDRLPAFFRQLRMDVAALYLSDPAVWQRIGFPGPSIASGGHPDFDQPQT